MTRSDFICELVRRFTESVGKGMPEFEEVQVTDNPNVFLGRMNGEYYFGHIRSPFDPIVTFRKAKSEEIIMDEQ